MYIYYEKQYGNGGEKKISQTNLFKIIIEPILGKLWNLT